MSLKLSKTYLLFIPLLILNIISLLNMINAKLISSSYNNAFFKQLFWYLLGYIIIYVIKRIKIKNYFQYSKYLYLFSIFLLVLVLFIGKEINGAKCWFSIFGFSFQPSELCKITLTLYLISIIDKFKNKNKKEEFILIIKLIFVTLIPSVLVFLEPDTGAIINYLIILLIVLVEARLNKWWYIGGTLLITSFLSLFFIMYFNYQDNLINILGTSLFYRMDRIINFANGSSYQLENALITIGSTTFLGVGFKKILLYIPEAPTDFVFAFSLGNYGLLSGIIIILSYLFINYYLINQMYFNQNKKYQLFISTYLSVFIFHQIYNIFMNIGLLPIMGIPLPFVSYGGTNILINFIYLGFILNMNSTRKKTKLYK